MATNRTNDHGSEPYFAGRAEQLIGQVVGTLDASAGHPADPDGGWPARLAALEDRLADLERRLARIENLPIAPKRPATPERP